MLLRLLTSSEFRLGFGAVASGLIFATALLTKNGEAVALELAAYLLVAIPLTVLQVRRSLRGE